MPRRERDSLALVALRLVVDAKVNGIHSELMGEFVHCRLGGVESGNSSGTAHISAASNISPGAAEGHAQIGHAVLKRCSFATVLVMCIEHGARVNVVVVQ